MRQWPHLLADVGAELTNDQPRCKPLGTAARLERYQAPQRTVGHLELRTRAARRLFEVPVRVICILPIRGLTVANIRLGGLSGAGASRW